jgi:hypothetical protein
VRDARHDNGDLAHTLAKRAEAVQSLTTIGEKRTEELRAKVATLTNLQVMSDATFQTKKPPANLPKA